MSLAKKLIDKQCIGSISDNIIVHINKKYSNKSFFNKRKGFSTHESYYTKILTQNFRSSLGTSTT